MKNSVLGTIAYWLVIIGAVNWGLVGLGYFFGGDWNLVYLLLGKWPVVENIVYIVVGLSVILSLMKCNCKSCRGMNMNQ